jgi:hypothetical protein
MTKLTVAFRNFANAPKHVCAHVVVQGCFFSRFDNELKLEMPLAHATICRHELAAIGIPLSFKQVICLVITNGKVCQIHSLDSRNFQKMSSEMTRCDS